MGPRIAAPFYRLVLFEVRHSPKSLTIARILPWLQSGSALLCQALAPLAGIVVRRALAVAVVGNQQSWWLVASEIDHLHS